MQEITKVDCALKMIPEVCQIKLAHGWNKGSVKQTDIISTIDSGINNWHTLLGEEIKVVGNYSPSNHNASRIVSKEGISPTVMENHGTVTAVFEGGVAIKNNNSKGYLIAQSGDGIDISSRMHHHRGTVQKGLSQTLDTQCNVGVIDETNTEKETM